MKQRRRVVVTGIGIVAPNGVGKQAFWANAMAGRSGVHPVEVFPTRGFKSRIAGQALDFDPLAQGLTAEQARRLDRYIQFALVAAREAVAESGLENAQVDKERVGVCVGNAICGTPLMERDFLVLTERGTRPIAPEKVRSTLYQAATFNVASAEVASRYGALGPSTALTTGCTGGLDAIGFALDCIRNGDADVMIAGAAEAPITPVAMAAFDVIGALSKRNDAPQKASRPYDKNRDGFVLGEGAGILILEERSHALRRGAPILAEVRGFGSCNNAFHMTDLPADGAALARSLRLALDDAGMRGTEVDYVSAHGSSTAQNDANETAALKSVLGAHAYEVPISSLKSMCGHPLAAANALEAVSSVLTLTRGELPPTINYETPDPACDLDYVPNEGRRKQVDVVLKGASGFSGIHSALVLTRPDYEGGLS
ncbi:beta-ketoacyl-[acyl-carrier-protein] synthase family protein [Pyxidicoccus fallax]|uniref:Beta-ketoacyl synthase alpha n=1 Tax=Pyxidicoccus fallax TaxID=394095 RepID=A0A346D7B2_9BACT|nr:beta-ketoacyl-[acyl-carrier-protein] synthase family protein [Pyxidicoccus fallax]AXM42927.1 beta-ketoacyl synthase alpha [Pyxidicoccus fallax]NMO18038.1 beta-ketoacyl-[acyl-carrier-protein] synthase family protein [Pyxidicoccus fallax]NPC78612.1 beta-ketoacyl-[acyl-carrier-protein] synthase family protein [Pyxidicoccus fallax]